MAEVFWNVTDQRVFDVSIEGDVVIKDLDLVRDIGASFTAKEYQFIREITDGVVNISFDTSVDFAKVSGIEVIYTENLPSTLSPIKSPTPAPIVPTISDPPSTIPSFQSDRPSDLLSEFPSDLPSLSPVDEALSPVVVRLNCGSFDFEDNDILWSGEVGTELPDIVTIEGGADYTDNDAIESISMYSKIYIIQC